MSIQKAEYSRVTTHVLQNMKEKGEKIVVLNCL